MESTTLPPRSRGGRVLGVGHRGRENKADDPRWPTGRMGFVVARTEWDCADGEADEGGAFGRREEAEQ